MKIMDSKIDISIIVTAHTEGLIAHKTMLSIGEACKSLVSHGFSYEILVSIDKGDDITKNYFAHRRHKQPLSVYDWSFGDLSRSRNAIIKEAKGRYISLIDADDLMSRNWPADALVELEQKPYGKYVAHSSHTVEFGDSNSIVVKYGSTNRDQDILLSVWSGRWNSVIIAPRNIFSKYKYAPNSSGYGYEDWHMSCSFINDGIISITIPKTCIFVRRKTTNSEWLRQKTSNSVLHSHPIFLPSNFKNIVVDNNLIITKNSNVKRSIKSLAKKNETVYKMLHHTASVCINIKNSIKQPKSSLESIPDWLNEILIELHKIDKQIFPPNTLPKLHHSITEDHYKVGYAYLEMCKLLKSDKYNYILFVPWLIPGGADLFAINYANSVSSLDKKVAVIATNETDLKSEWSKLLNSTVDFIPFGEITKDLSSEHKGRIIEHLIENTKPSIIHILNSALGYEFIQSHESYIKSINLRIFATAFSQSTDESGRIFGFSHTHIPNVYNLLEKITTDNDSIRQVWIDEYAFDPKKIDVHHQPLITSTNHISEFKLPKNSHKILWASRLSEEKIPNLVHKIAELLPENITIDMYGFSSSEFPVSKLVLNDKVSYKGPFDSISSLTTEDYCLYLYTSLFDGMPNTPIEISLKGLPIVAADVGGLRGFIGSNGYIVNDRLSAKSYAEAINKALTNYGDSQEKARKLYIKASKTFTEKAFNSEVKSLIEDN